MALPRPNLVQLEFHLLKGEPSLRATGEAHTLDGPSVTVIQFYDPDQTATQIVARWDKLSQAREAALTAFLKARGFERLTASLALRYWQFKARGLKRSADIARHIFALARKDKRSFCIKASGAFRLLNPHEVPEVVERIAEARTAYTFVFKDTSTTLRTSQKMIAAIN